MTLCSPADPTRPNAASPPAPNEPPNDNQLAAQPTRGLDIAATRNIHDLFMAQRKAGVATLLISEDLDELSSLCDRLIVLFRGRIVARFDRASFHRDAIGRAMAGIETSA